MYNDLDETMLLLDLHAIPYRLTGCWDENNNPGYAIWLESGAHIEFDKDGNITNVVAW